MTHSEVRALLGDYLEGDLESAEHTRIQAHLPDCAECSDELRELRETVVLLRNLPEVEPPSDFAAAVMGRIEAGEATAPIVLRAFRSLVQPRFAAPLAAGLTGLALFVGLQAITPDHVTAPVRPLAGTALAQPQGAGFRGRSDYLTPDFIEKRLDAIEQYAGARQQQEIRAFVEQLRLTEDDAHARRLLADSRHHLAPTVVLEFQPIVPQRPSAPIPVKMTSSAR